MKAKLTEIRSALEYYRKGGDWVSGEVDQGGRAALAVIRLDSILAELDSEELVKELVRIIGDTRLEGDLSVWDILGEDEELLGAAALSAINIIKGE